MKFKNLLASLAVVTTIVAGLSIWAAPEAQALGSTYYVDNSPSSNCSDSGPGSQSAPWCSFTPANSLTFGPGDQLLLARGDAWDQQLTLHGAGSATAHASLSAYGTGANPKILRDSQPTQMAVDAQDPSYFDYSDLELGDAGIGLRVYLSTLGHAGLSFSNISVHDNTGWTFTKSDPQCEATNRTFVPAGIAVTGDLPPFSSSDYALDGVDFTNIVGTRNVDSVALEMCNGIASTANGLSWTYNGTALTTDGQDDDNLIRNVVMRGLNFSGDNGPGAGGCPDALRINDSENVTIMDSILNNETCKTSTGTAAVILQRTDHVRFVNDILTNTPATGSTDQTAIDLEKHNTNDQFDHDYIAGNAGPGIEVLAIAGSDDQESGHVIEADLFADNGSATPNYTGSVYEGGTGIVPTVTVQGNLYDEPSGGLLGDGAVTASGFTVTQNHPVIDETNAAGSFGSTQGSGGWSYEYSVDNGSTWNPLTWDASSGVWDNAGSAPTISRFDQKPAGCAGCLVSRTWTAPAAGAVSVVADALSTQPDDSVATVLLNKSALVAPSTVSLSTEVPVALNAISVAAGDKLRFVVSAESSSASDDTTSFVPSIGYAASVTPPTTPTNAIVATVGGHDQISWNAVAHATSYAILRGASAAGPFSQLATIASPMYTYQPTGGPYYYEVTATNDFGTSGPSAIAQKDLAAGSAVTASSTVNSGGWSLAGVADGNAHSSSTSLGWTSNNTLTTSHTEWVQEDLGSPKLMSAVTLYPVDNGAVIGSDFPIDYTIQTSNDAATWTTVKSITGQARPTTPLIYNIAPVTARYVRVTGTKLNFTVADKNAYRMQFAEIAVLPAPEDETTTPPSQGVLSSTSGWSDGLADGNFDLNFNMWWGTNGSAVVFYENGQEIGSQVLSPSSPNAQSATLHVAGRPNGSYVYTTTLLDQAGVSTTTPITVNVTDANPASPSLSNDNWDGDGNFTVSTDLWWGTNASKYQLYEDGQLIDTQSVTPASPGSQHFSTTVSGANVGDHVFYVVLSNAAGTTQSSNMIVSVTD